MRPDVKLGIVVSIVVVIVMGGYYLYRGNRETPIRVDGLEANDLVDNAKTLADKSHSNVASHKSPAGTTRQAAGPRGHKAVRRNVANSPMKQRRVGASPSTMPTHQRSARKRPSTQSTPRTTATTRQASTTRTPAAMSRSPQKTPSAHNGPSSMQSKPQKHLASNKQTYQPETSSPTVSASFRKPVPLVALPKATVRAAPETHRVLPGETLASIAETYFGSVQYARLLLKANPSVANPRSLQVGMLIKIPAQNDETVVDRAKNKTSSAAPVRKIVGKTYIVKSGDSLFVIAKRELGNGARWKEIFKLNKSALGNNPNRLKVGQTLAMPAS